jgi:hypothetical protein
MAGTTTNGLPYPTGTDLLMNGDNAIQALAEAIDAKTLASTGILTLAAAGFTPAAGFSGLAGAVLKRGGLVGMTVTALVSTNALASGDMGNLVAVNVPAAYQPLITAPITSGASGPGLWGHVINGTVILSASGTGVAAAQSISLVGVWLAAQ